MVRDISEIRKQALKKDPGTQLIVDRVETTKKLVEVTKKKRKELEDTKEATKSLLASATSEADRLVKEATQRASDLITQARSKKSQAESLFAQVKTKQKEVEDLEVVILDRDKQSKQKQELIDIIEKDVNKKEENVDNLFDLASKREKQVVDILGITITLLQLVVENSEQFVFTNKELTLQVGSLFEKSKEVFKQANDLMKRVEAGQRYNEQTKKKVEIEKLRLKDKEETLARTTDRLRKKGIVV